MKNSLYEYRVRRVRFAARDLNTTINSPRDAAACFRLLCAAEGREIFMAASLDARNKVLGIEKVAIGGAAHVDVHPREVFRAAILTGAVGLVVGHNHPSEDVSPSPDDIQLTNRLREAGELLGIPVLDHVIVADEDFFSIAEHGWCQ